MNQDYRRGVEDSIRAVEGVQIMMHGGKWIPREQTLDALCNLLVPRHERETHEETWAAAGWPFKWCNERRCYKMFHPKFEYWILKDTVQDVYNWIAEQVNHKEARR